jgi:hypothetical protein
MVLIAVLQSKIKTWDNGSWKNHESPRSHAPAWKLDYLFSRHNSHFQLVFGKG